MSARTANAEIARVPPVGIAPAADAQTALFERLATDPNVSVEKIERMMALWERNEARKAEAAFSVAMAEAQKQMRPVANDAHNPQTRSRYASYEALDLALRPIYTEFGFGLSFNTDDSPKAEHVRVVCKVTHVAGHREFYHIDMPADGKGAKGGDVMTKTHATGSAVSYGMRYLLKMIFNVATGEGDDDGNAAGGTPTPAVPDGYDEWFDRLCAAAERGLTALQKVWSDTNQDRSEKVYAHYLQKTSPSTWNALKKTAAKVKEVQS